jgi:hypothetical protein
MQRQFLLQASQHSLILVLQDDLLRSMESVFYSVFIKGMQFVFLLPVYRTTYQADQNDTSITTLKLEYINT